MMDEDARQEAHRAAAQGMIDAADQVQQLWASIVDPNMRAVLCIAACEMIVRGDEA